MGCLPIQMTMKMRNIKRCCVEQENKDSVLYNQKLAKKLPEIETSLPGSKFLYANVYDPVMDMIQNPSIYGFKETKKGCCGTGYMELSFLCNSFSRTCPNHSDHLFWDSIHPSEAAYTYLGNLIDAQIQEWLWA
ncbi:PREDICTED: GDSL esterase/lipase At2g30220-like [Camelina sativa]|uniref:GDSL esterase/lipase At2g30220-like n=1 Tax=Camelina sativa TaxID=90675 RepID=A0ABM1Q8F2_CAMSA|nr:PREDICTED: GDSL esterase/lipase At2g30220-like [Camelina sativa]